MAKNNYGRRRDAGLGRTAPEFGQCQLLFNERGLSLSRCTERFTTTFRVYRGASEVGTAELRATNRTKPRAGGATEPVLKVSYIELAPKERKGRVGTLLYDAMLGEACDRGQPLTSDRMRSHFAEAFWRKQVRKGRAKCVRSGRGGELYRAPLLELGQDRDAGKITEAKYNEIVAKLPKPRSDGTWSCYRYDVNNTCDVATLAGVKKRRGKRKR